MDITINRIKVNSKEVFPLIDDFILYLKKNYSNINFDNESMKSSIISIYNKMINDDGNIRYARLTRWLPSQFGFKHSNKFSLPFWMERGFTEKDYKLFTEDVFKDRGERLSNLAKKRSQETYNYDPNYSNLYAFSTQEFISDERPKCNICNSELIVKKSTKIDQNIFLIEGCSNKNCKANSAKNKKLRWQAFLPESEYLSIEKNLKSVKRSFSKEFWIKKGYSEEDAIKKVIEIQSNNSRKFTGKRTGKSKDLLRAKGYTEEQIKLTCLSPSNIEFWINKGYSEEDAKTLISKNQSNAAKFVDCEKRLLPSNVEYWINKGYSENESKKLVKKSQTTFSREICIEKYGYEKGIEIFNERTKRWLNSLKDNDNIFIGYSAISQELFAEIFKRLENRNFKYALNGGEFKIKKENGGYYFYDFTDVDNKLIIEYNGDMYHANPLVYNESDSPHPFRKNLKSSDIWEKDKLKFEAAKKEGFDILIVWDSEYRYKGEKNRELVIEKCLNFLNENKKI